MDGILSQAWGKSGKTPAKGISRVSVGNMESLARPKVVGKEGRSIGEPLEEDRVGGREMSDGTVIANKMRGSDMEERYKEAQRRTAKVWLRVGGGDKGEGIAEGE